MLLDLLFHTETTLQSWRYTSTVKSPECILKGQVPYITVNPRPKKLLFRYRIKSFYTALDLKGGDIIMAIQQPYSLDNIYDMISESQNWKENDNTEIKTQWS
jgi:hypothetical protein